VGLLSLPLAEFKLLSQLLLAPLVFFGNRLDFLLFFFQETGRCVLDLLLHMSVTLCDSILKCFGHLAFHLGLYFRKFLKRGLFCFLHLDIEYPFMVFDANGMLLECFVFRSKSFHVDQTFMLKRVKLAVLLTLALFNNAIGPQGKVRFHSLKLRVLVLHRRNPLISH